MARERLSINLLDDKQRSFTDTLLDWAIYIGRLLVILTESIALFVFLNRFTLDRRLIDLHDEIKKNQSFVGYMQSREELYRRVQEKLTLNEKSNTDNEKKIALFEELLTQSDRQIRFLNISITPSALAFTIQAPSVQALSAFTNKIKAHPSIAILSIDKIENKTTNALIVVSYTAKLVDKN